jgi:hypothetical protein
MPNIDFFNDIRRAGSGGVFAVILPKFLALSHRRHFEVVAKSRVKPLLDLSERKFHVGQAVSRSNKNINGNWMYAISASAHGSRSCPSLKRNAIAISGGRVKISYLFLSSASWPMSSQCSLNVIPIHLIGGLLLNIRNKSRSIR